jgi:ElaB/YqjD/DUF883 family membrane-anchored ribosome-binding protein
MFGSVTSRRQSQEQRAARVLHQHPLRVANEELRILMSRVEDLVDRLGSAPDPELKRLRTRADAALTRAKAAIGKGGAQLGDQARQLAEQAQEHVRRRPLTALGLVALSMLAIGLLSGRAKTAD